MNNSTNPSGSIHVLELGGLQVLQLGFGDACHDSYPYKNISDKAFMLDEVAFIIHQIKHVKSILMHQSMDDDGNMAFFDTTMMTEVLDMTDVNDTGFAQRLRDLRRQKGLSQSELGKLADLHYTHIGRFERGTSRPGDDTLKRLAYTLDVTRD
ncbi:helix-turn-helix transcriptional regulator [Brenneria sp. 4F2]|nr:helix-turn-helix transcriptional regulator [Brenneria bubanii]